MEKGGSAPAWASWAEGPYQTQLAGGACIHGKGPIPHLRRCVPLKVLCQAGFLPGGVRVGVLDPERARRRQPAVLRSGHQEAARLPRGPAALRQLSGGGGEPVGKTEPPTLRAGGVECAP